MDVMLEAHLDFETRSPTDLRKSGVYRYAEDPDTGVWGFSWRLGDMPPQQWRPGYPDPQLLLDHVASGGVVKAHNAGFERRIWNHVIRVRYASHWPELKIEQQDCTMARAAAIAHPAGLDQLCQVVGAPNKKDKEGHGLMMKMARPRRYNPDETIVWWDEPENVDRCMQYCDQDVLTECDVDERVPPLSESEKQVWNFDQLINDRGIYIDVNAVEKAAVLVEYAKKEADKIMRNLTDRAVPRCTNDGKLVAWLQSRGLEFDTVKKGVLDDIIFMAGLQKDKVVKDVIELRRVSKKTSTAKYAAMLNCVCSDWRIRGLLRYHGASTGRWAGQLVQPQNFPRVDYDEEGFILEWMHDLFRADYTPKETYELIASVHGEDSVLQLLSRGLRSMICAPPGKQLIGGDFSNIEGRVNTWLANEEWKLQAFRDYDESQGQDLYKLAAGRILGKDAREITGFERQSVGKVSELSLGFQGSVGAFVSMGDNYGITPYDLSGTVYEKTSSAVWDATAEKYHQKGTNRYNLREKEWTAVKVIVDAWRAAHPNIVQSWWDYQDAAVEAVGAPGNVVYVAGNRVAYYSDGRCLWCVLPSGRMLCYSAPELVREEYEYTDSNGETKSRWRNKVTFWGLNSMTRQWSKQSLYGGLQCENIVQATARDIMVDRMLAVEHAGYPIILTVHDEIVSETPLDRSDLNAQSFQDIMSILPQWANGLPLSVKAWEYERYVK